MKKCCKNCSGSYECWNCMSDETKSSIFKGLNSTFHRVGTFEKFETRQGKCSIHCVQCALDQVPMDESSDSDHKLFSLEKPKEALPKSIKVYWATVNYKPTVTLEEIITKMQSFNKSWVLNLKYVYEQRSDAEPFSGYHNHMLLFTKLRLSETKRNLQNYFKKVCDVKNPRILNIRHLTDNDQIQTRLDYLNGHKQKKKETKVIADRLFRIKYNLKPLYTV